MPDKFIRLLELPEDHHFLLFGARNTGKSTLLEKRFHSDYTLFIDLFEESEFEHFSRKPDDLYQIAMGLPETITHVVIDEIQRVPKLLNVVQRLMKDSKKTFLLSGSSARKLKRGGANLLAGRAFVYHLFPLTYLELGEHFELDRALQWGTLPDVFNLNSDKNRQQFLQAYCHTYLKEEIWEEQFVRQLDPFRKFLEVAAQSNAKIINHSNIAKDVGVDHKTIQNYFSILEDTLIGFYLEPYHNSLRKRLTTKPKFYFFDTGVVRSLARMTSATLLPQTSAYGEAFEHYIIIECMRLASMYKPDYRFSYLQTHSGTEIDLIVDRPGQPLLAIEIKSTTSIDKKDLSSFLRLSADLPNAETVCFCQERYPKQIEHALVLPWQQGIKRFFTE